MSKYSTTNVQQDEPDGDQPGDDGDGSGAGDEAPMLKLAQAMLEAIEDAAGTADGEIDVDELLAAMAKIREAGGADGVEQQGDVADAFDEFGRSLGAQMGDLPPARFDLDDYSGEQPTTWQSYDWAGSE